MLDYDFLKRLGIESKYYMINMDKSYTYFDTNTLNLTTELYLLKDTCICPLCRSKILCVKKTVVSNVYTQMAEANNAIVHVHRYVFSCDNNHTFRQENPFKSDGHKISIFKDEAILNDLRDCTNTYTAVAKKYQVSPTYVINLFDTRVDLKRLTLPQVLCIDEVYARKLVKNGYCFVLYSPQWRKIIDVLDNRKKLNLIDYFARIPNSEKDNVKYVSMDLYDIYRQVISKCLPKAIICADPFHVVKHLVDCFDKIRKRVMKRYENLKDEGHNYYWLYKKYKWMLFKSLDKIKDFEYHISKSKMILNKYQILHYMLELDSTLDVAYNLMMIYRDFVATATINNAAEKLAIIMTQFKEAHIPEYADFIRLVNNWSQEIINSFNTINGHKITNGPMERVNEDIKTIIRISFGSTNFIRTRNRILFCINDTAPILSHRKDFTNKKIGPKRGPYKKKL